MMSYPHQPAFLGQRVRYVRERMRMSPTQMAAAIGLPGAEAQAELEAGRLVLTDEQLMALADVWEPAELDFYLTPLHVTGEAQYTWYGDMTGIDREALEARASQWVGLVRWLREQTHSTTDPMEVLFVDLNDRAGAHLGGLVRVGNLQVALFNRRDMHYKGVRRELPKLFSTATMLRLHLALDRGWLTARRAARSLGVSLQEMGELFEAYGLSDPVCSSPTGTTGEAIAALNATLAALPG